MKSIVDISGSPWAIRNELRWTGKTARSMADDPFGSIEYDDLENFVGVLRFMSYRISKRFQRRFPGLMKKWNSLFHDIDIDITPSDCNELAKCLLTAAHDRDLEKQIRIEWKQNVRNGMDLLWKSN